MKNNNNQVYISLLVVVIILLIVALRNSNKESDYDKAVRHSLINDYKSGQIIDCTSPNRDNVACDYLERHNDGF